MSKNRCGSQLQDVDARAESDIISGGSQGDVQDMAVSTCKDRLVPLIFTMVLIGMRPESRLHLLAMAAMQTYNIICPI